MYKDLLNPKMSSALHLKSMMVSTFGKDIFNGGEESIINTIFDSFAKNLFFGAIENAYVHYGRLYMLTLNMQSIKKFDKVLFKKYNRALKKSVYDNNFYGLRMEINTIAHFIQKNISFNKQESPDFEITHNGNKVYIECTSVVFERKTSTNEDVLKKILFKINEKNEKPYASNSTSLWIETTNMTHRVAANSMDLDNRYLKKEITKYLQTHPHIKYGSIYLYQGFYHPLSQRFIIGHTGIIGDNASYELNNFLETYFPVVHPDEMIDYGYQLSTFSM
ncbi:hypothetical protein [Sulfurimonas diazotrophicus]|uniref:Uncharacterized protein n=1 Tax=Sulfurimonas diazotrophicus TaxID=3131939 RepID=A0ABZ3HAI9_9BACT